jgi:tripartite-type tricarboxylate transporter receptor subunit TctC
MRLSLLFLVLKIPSVFVLLLYLFAPFSPVPSILAQEPFYYKGETIRIIVGFPPGGGADLYSRTIARHLGKHISGNPAVAVENMPGPGGLIAANHLYKEAKPDGLTIAHFSGGLFMQQLLGKAGIEFDSHKFEYIGVPTQDNYMLGISKRVGVRSIEEWFASKKVIKFGGVAPGSHTYDIPRILKETIGLPAQVVTGYKGTGPIRIAFSSGEVDGVNNSWEFFRATWRKDVESGEVIVVLQNVAKRHPELPNVPLAIDYARTEEARKLLRALVHPIGSTARPYALPPGTSKERVEVLRRAFMATMKDPEFLADAGKAKLDITPLDGATLEQNVKEISLEPTLIPKAREILK